MTWVAVAINKALRMSSNNNLVSLASPDDRPPNLSPSMTVFKSLNRLSVNLDKDLVVFFDEVDCLIDAPLITFLRQIRLGYNNRFDSPASKFPRSIAFVAPRDIRDYEVKTGDGQYSSGVASMFNIIKEAFALPNFTPDEIAHLYHQHTEASGQAFEALAVERAWYWSEGQPWLVNALAYESVVNILKNDYSQLITSDIMNQAAENLIQRRDNHLDSILKRLKEPRVRAVMEPIILGARRAPIKVPLDDQRYVVDLGLLKGDYGNLRPANPIYKEVFIKTLDYPFEAKFDKKATMAKSNRWIDGQKLDMTSLLKAFQQFWRENIEILETPYGYTQSLPLQVMNAFLQRILNSDVIYLGREYALGKRRVDLYAKYMGIGYPIELKIMGTQILNRSLAQINNYMDICGAKEGWLVIFDNKSQKSWDEKLTWKTTQYEGSTIHLVGC